MIEAGLIVGPHRDSGDARLVDPRRWIGFGIAAGVFGAAVVACSPAPSRKAFEGAGQELFNASVLGIAVLMLMWHNALIAGTGREIAAEMRTVGHAVCKAPRPLTALAVVVGLAVLRGRLEVVLFLYGIFASGTSGIVTCSSADASASRPARGPSPRSLISDCWRSRTATSSR